MLKEYHLCQNGIQKGKGQGLRAEPSRIKPCRVSPCGEGGGGGVKTLCTEQNPILMILLIRATSGIGCHLAREDLIDGSIPSQVSFV